ncbi:methylated-DNA--protein-cysteine methyltransferase-like [Watersipora subatra]|uniref:methylated-DNA--protein-cysteine methyltransferase-like n=1 Tax=Watersipora subatra TaxID=2589382 RepID=UPI00355B39CF
MSRKILRAPIATEKGVMFSCGPCSSMSVTSPTGVLQLVACSDGMHKLHISQPSVSLSRNVACELLNESDEQLNGPLESCLHWLKAYFTGDVQAIDACRPALCSRIFHEESFRSKVWCTLERQVKFGETVSYGQLAELCGNPRASQAVGSAMRNNPVALVVPCHRVILASGLTGNYSGGKLNNTKSWLLEHEKASVLQ